MKTLLPSITKNFHCTFFVIAAILFFCKTTAQPTLGFNKILSGLNMPVDIKNAGDGSNRLFIVEQPGTIKIYKKGSVLSTPFLDISNLVYYAGGEQGLLSIAFPPNYSRRGVFFVYYNNKNGDITLARYHVSNANPDIANPSSGKVLFSRPKPNGYTNHNGGSLHFGKDGYLYLSIGDGGGAGDQNGNGQSGQTFFGKMLRLNVNMPDSPYYKIPPDNPFVNDPNVLDEIWALGLRNPWKWSFDRQTHDTWIADVGQDKWEEVDFRKPAQIGGSNFGWRCYEGHATYNTAGCKARSNYVFPIFDYQHGVSNGGRCIIGGYVYRGSKFTDLQGYYICVDYLSANSWKIKPDGAGGWNVYLQKNVPSGIISFGENEAGELYASTSAGNIYHVITTSNFVTASSASDIGATIPAFVYPTVVANGSITIVLNDAYKVVRLLDMNGNELMQRDITAVKGNMSLRLPKLSPGTYIVQLIGNKTMQQKIYVSR
jgi:glucose/arabinose dehydrogenase